MKRAPTFALLLSATACGPAADPWSASVTARRTGDRVARALQGCPSGTAPIEREARCIPRPAAEVARDAYRHPSETLAFFGLRDTMHVIELSPGRGWYTAILGPTLRGTGRLTVATADPNGPTGPFEPSTYLDKGAPEAEVAAAIKAQPNIYGTLQVLDLQRRMANSPMLLDRVWVQPFQAPYNVYLGPDESADMVLTFRNFHNWYQTGAHDKILAAAFRVLRTGGTLGIVDHRADPSHAEKDSLKRGYIREDVVIREALQAGFVLVARSEINANDRDTKDYEHGVWALPPTLRGGAKDRDKFVEIGESDRMTLRFVKPAHTKGYKPVRATHGVHHGN